MDRQPERTVANLFCAGDEGRFRIQYLSSIDEVQPLGGLVVGALWKLEMDATEEDRGSQRRVA